MLTNGFIAEYATGIPSWFLGRTAELDFLKRSLADGSRAVIVLGRPGVGKTALVHYFAHANRDSYPGGAHFAYAYDKQGLQSFLDEHIASSSTHKTLLIIDEAHSLSESAFSHLQQALDSTPHLSVVLIGQRQEDFHDPHYPRLELGGLTKPEFLQLIQQRLSGVDPHSAEKFFQLVDGNPLIAELAGSSIREGLFTVSQLFRAFGEFRTSGLFGPDGKPYSPSDPSPIVIASAVANVNDELVARLKETPELMRTISPRKFEELIAELLRRQGYDVELTPATRDGGRDIYAARSDGLGRFLYFVECKRYTPPSKVGVQVVRALYGTVQQSKATAGIVATTSFFTKDAVEFQREVKYQLQLRDFFELKRWLGLL